MGKARRRHDEQRKKAKAARVLTSSFGFTCLTPKTIGMWAANMKPCSCHGCGNRRRYEGETRQEKANK